MNHATSNNYHHQHHDDVTDAVSSSPSPAAAGRYHATPHAIVSAAAPSSPTGTATSTRITSNNIIYNNKKDDETRKQETPLTRTCQACRYSPPREEYFPNHWNREPLDEFARCRTCVRAGIFKVSQAEPEFYWVGWPKCAVQILLERGWNPPQGIHRRPDDIGQLIMSLPDRQTILQYFETVGHHGYGGNEEGICCMPGCVKDSGLKWCGHCFKAQYCSVEHQQLHWFLHVGVANEEDYEDNSSALQCKYNANVGGEQNANGNGNANAFTANGNANGNANAITVKSNGITANGNGNTITANNNINGYGVPIHPARPIVNKHTHFLNPLNDLAQVAMTLGVGNRSAVHNLQDQQLMKTLMNKNSDNYGSDASITDRDDVRPVVRRTDAQLATKFSFAVLAQFCPCAFRAADMQGKRRGLSHGFPGLQCRHCFGMEKKGGRFFPSTIKTMADTKKTLVSIKNHLMKCTRCPDSIKAKINDLVDSHEEERKAQKYGSQKAFFSNIWGRLHHGHD